MFLYVFMQADKIVHLKRPMSRLETAVKPAREHARVGWLFTTHQAQRSRRHHMKGEIWRYLLLYCLKLTVFVFFWPPVALRPSTGSKFCPGIRSEFAFFLYKILSITVPATCHMHQQFSCLIVTSQECYFTLPVTRLKLRHLTTAYYLQIIVNFQNTFLVLKISHSTLVSHSTVVDKHCTTTQKPQPCSTDRQHDAWTSAISPAMSFNSFNWCPITAINDFFFSFYCWSFCECFTLKTQILFYKTSSVPLDTFDMYAIPNN